MDFTGFDVVIWGITAAGKPFRPSDWTDRIAGLTSAFGEDRKVIYSPLVMKNALASPHGLIPPALPAGAGREPREPV